mmetsp:Transcript_31949/g.68003  ORF Transcript_31949/g.68003 Transcript_31949/m.68003 type:complete len:114 (+) Transcript_31949:604-945(+)
MLTPDPPCRWYLSQWPTLLLALYPSQRSWEAASVAAAAAAAAQGEGVPISPRWSDVAVHLRDMLATVGGLTPLAELPEEVGCSTVDDMLGLFPGLEREGEELRKLQQQQQQQQ